MIYTTFVTNMSSSLNQFVPELARSLACLSCNYYLGCFFFSKSLIPYIGSLDKCLTSTFNALIFSFGKEFQDLVF